MTEIKLDLKSAIIIFLAVCVVVLGSYLHDSYKTAIEDKEARQRIQGVQEILSPLLLPQELGQAFQRKGFTVNIQALPQVNREVLNGDQ